jgi:hypothetical protein
MTGHFSKSYKLTILIIENENHLRREIAAFKENSMNKTWASSFGFVLLMFAAVVWAEPVPDTGQTRCYDNTNVIPCPSPGQPFYCQDANYSLNPLSYTKLDDSGNVLPDSATSWVTVLDNVTGLVWETKTNKDGVKNYNDPHDADNTYTWYDSNPATNGGYAGTPGNDTDDTSSFVKTLNDAHYGGYSDWRMPTVKELSNIHKYDISSPGPTINTYYFSDTQASFHWTSTTYAGNINGAWGVDFANGGGGFSSKSYSYYYVRAVRGGQSGSLSHLAIGSLDAVDSRALDCASTAVSSYTDNGDGTVTDTITGLAWQQTGSSNKTWEQALAYCEGLNLGGHTDWRMPNIKELRSLVDYSLHKPAINTMYFPDTVSPFYWSSTTFPTNTSSAWGLHFDDGDDHYGNKFGSFYVRAVRGGLTTSIIGSNSIDSIDVVKITDMSGSLPDSGGAVTIRAWDKDGKQLTEAGHALPISIFNYATTSIPGADIEDRFPEGIPAAYTFAVESSKMFITNVNNSFDGAVKVPIIYSNMPGNFVSNSIGSRNTLKVTDISGAIASEGIAISVTAWDASGKAIPESASAAPLKLYSHGTTTIAGSTLPARFPSGAPMTYEFTVASPKLVVSNVKNSSDGTLNIPTTYTVGVSHFVSNSIGSGNNLHISDFSGTLDIGGIAINVRAWDVSGTEIPESGGAASLKLYAHGTTSIPGSNLIARFPSGSPMTYEFTVGSSKIVITNVKSSSDGGINIPTVYTSGITNYATNYISNLNTIKITDMSGGIASGGASITITARDGDGNIIAESGSAAALKLYNHGTTTIEGSDLQNRFSGGVPVSYEFYIGSSNAVVTHLTKSLDGTINIPTVSTIGPSGGI